MTSLSLNSFQEALDLRSDVMAIIVPLIKVRFSTLVGIKIFQVMKLTDLQFWNDDQTINP